MNIISHKSCISNKKTPISGYNCNTVLEYRPILPFSPCLQGKTVRKGKRKFSCRPRIAEVYPQFYTQEKADENNPAIGMTGQEIWRYYEPKAQDLFPSV